MLKKYAAASDRMTAWLEAHIDELRGPLDIGGIAVICGLAFTDARRPDYDWRSPNPGLAGWYDEIRAQPFFTETDRQANEQRLGVAA